MTIFWVWKGDTDPRPVVSSFGSSWWEYDGMRFGVVDGDAALRHALIDASEHLVVLPGVNGKLNADQADAISPAFAGAKAGDAMFDVLDTIYTGIGIEAFNPNAY